MEGVREEIPQWLAIPEEEGHAEKGALLEVATSVVVPPKLRQDNDNERNDACDRENGH